MTVDGGTVSLALPDISLSLVMIWPWTFQFKPPFPDCAIDIDL